MVKTGRLELIIEILTSQMNHWIFFPLIMTVLGLFMQFSGNIDGGPCFLLWVVCGLIPPVCFLIRDRAERFGVFALCHGAVMAAALLLASRISIIEAVICVVCGAAYIIYSFMLRLRENATVYSDNIHPLTALGVSVVANFMFHRQEDMPDWDRYYLFILIGVFACYLIIYYLKHYLSFLQVNKSSAGYLPAKEILHAGIGFVLPYTLIGVLILTLSLNVEWLEPILRILKEGLKSLLRFLIGLLPNGETAAEQITIENVGSTPDAGIFDRLPTETFWLWEVLEPLSIILFFIACAYGLIKALKKLAKFLQEQFGKRAANGDLLTGECEIFDVREKCSIAKKDTNDERTGLFHRFTPAERIRRLYKKRVLSGKKAEEDRSALNYMTARECGNELSLPHMAELYEQTRYSDRETTAEDVKRMKLACSGRVSHG